MQHPRLGFEGIPGTRPAITETSRKGKKIASLPESYTNIPPNVYTKKDNLIPPAVNIPQSEVDEMSTTLAKEYEWLNNLHDLLDKPELDKEDNI